MRWLLIVAQAAGMQVAQPPRIEVLPVRPPPAPAETRAPAPMPSDNASPPAPALTLRGKVSVPSNNPITWATDADYPAASVRAREAGRVMFRLDIAKDGRPTGCTVIQSSASPALDRLTCSLILRRARFKPIIDDRGKPAKGSYTSTVRWFLPSLPKLPIRFVEAGGMSVTLAYSGSGGRHTSCDVSGQTPLIAHFAADICSAHAKLNSAVASGSHRSGGLVSIRVATE